MDEKELEALKASNPKAYEFIVGQKAELEKFKAAPPKKEEPPKNEPDPKEDPDLVDKALKERQAKEKSADRDRQLESAIKFTMGSGDFLKQNKDLLPKDAEEIFKLAEKENYSDAIEKDAAIKAGLIKSFFSVQAHVDLMTPSQKAALDDYLKLTKNGKQEKAQAIYDMIFEPVFESLKRVKRAEALNRGHGTPSDVEDGYRKRLMAGSRKHYLGEKDA